MDRSTTQIARPSPAQPAGRGVLQRQCACGKHAPGGECEECRKKRLALLQRAEDGPARRDAAPPSVHRVLGQSGAPLDAAVRRAAERLFGHDFSRVRIHTGPEAAGSARSVSALAYTVGPHIVFGPGRFAPGSSNGRRLLYHELAHVVQQRDAAYAVGHLPLAGPRWEREADAAAEAALAGRPAEVTGRAVRTELARENCATIAEPDGSELTIDRLVIPGQCRRRPRSEVSTRSSADASRASFVVDLCRGRVSGQVHGSLEYEEVVQGAAQAFAQFFTDLANDPGRAAGNLQEAFAGLSPEAQFHASFDIGELLVVRGRGRGSGSIAGGVEGEASAEALIRVLEGGDFRIRIGPQVEVEGGTGGRPEDVRGGLVLEVEIGERPETQECQVCGCTTPRMEYTCRRREPRPSPQPAPPTPQPIHVPLFFEYEEVVPRPGWEDRYQRALLLAVQQIQEGYSIRRIEGATSPEGPLERRRSGTFEGNVSLAQRRAEEAQRDLEEAIQSRLTVLRSGTEAYDRLRRALGAGYQVVGRAELFGSTEAGEVPSGELFGHLERTVGTPPPGRRDPLAQERVIGEGLPESLRPEIESEAETFRDPSRSRTERQTAIYSLLRRAIIELEPPQAPAQPLVRPITPGDFERTFGTQIPCTEEHIRACATRPVPRDRLFDGDCREGTP
jgi:hypothetical protein